MEELERELFPGVRLTTIRTDKFHSGCFSIHLLRPLRADEAARCALLPAVLRRGTRTMPDQTRLSDALDGLYGSSLEPELHQMGETVSSGFQAVFPDERFLPGAEDCLSRIIALSGEMLLDPATRGGLLRDDYVRSEGQNLHDRIRAAVNNKRGYAVLRARELMFEGEAFGVFPLGKAEEALRIRKQPLTKYYRDVLRTSPVELFYCGSAAPERVEEIVRRAFMTLPGGDNRVLPEAADSPCIHELRQVTEEMDVEQGNLVLGFRYRHGGAVDYPALAVFNELFGGGDASRLFLELREKRSLCYAIDSSVERYKKCMLVEAGIDSERREEAEEAVLSALSALAKGDISAAELETARRNVQAAYLEGLDDPAALCAFRLGQNLLGCGGDLRQHAALAAEVRREDVARIASEMKPELSYFLRGGGAK